MPIDYREVMPEAGGRGDTGHVTASKDDEVVSFLLPLSSSRSVVPRHPRKHVDAEPSTRAWTSTVGCGSMDRPGWFGWWRCKG